MITTQSFKATQPKSLLDECNRESGRIYSRVMATHWRIYRKKGVWLSEYTARRLNDYLMGTTNLHAHSRDVAQQSFHKACKTAKALKKKGFNTARYPYKRKYWRTTVWLNTGIRIRDGVMVLARARGLEPLRVHLPAAYQYGEIREARLVFNRRAKRYDWHIVIEDGANIPKATGTATVAVDMGEIHPAAACDESVAVVFSAREARAIHRRRNDALARLASKQSKCKSSPNKSAKGGTVKSRRWKKFQAAKNRVKRHAAARLRDMNHKVSRAVVSFAQERNAGTLVIGDVRNIADKTDKGKTQNRRLSNWNHGQLRQYMTYKAERLGMSVALQNEAYTSQTCPCCGNRKKERSRVYRCSTCQFVGSRDGQVGAANILSQFLYQELARVQVLTTTYRHPCLTGKRKLEDTQHVAC